jgi:hypothetical protein
MSENYYKVNEPVLVVFQALGGTPGITDLQIIVTDPQGNVSSPVTMTEASGGLYEAEFTPDELGRWWVKVFSSQYPENAQKTSYFVGYQEGVNGIIIRDVNGNYAELTATGRVKVSQEPPTAPPDTTAVINREYGLVSTSDDIDYLIPSGETLTLQRFSAGGQQAQSGNVVELWYDPNGNGVDMEIIDTIFRICRRWHSKN